MGNWKVQVNLRRNIPWSGVLQTPGRHRGHMVGCSTPGAPSCSTHHHEWAAPTYLNRMIQTRGEPCSSREVCVKQQSQDRDIKLPNVENLTFILARSANQLILPTVPCFSGSSLGEINPNVSQLTHTLVPACPTPGTHSCVLAQHPVRPNERLCDCPTSSAMSTGQ